jgi:hypothetical protein
MRKQCLEFALPKPGEICKHLAELTIQTVIPVGFCYLTFVCENKQGNLYYGVSHLKENCLRKAQHYRSSLKEEKTLAIYDPTNIVAKKPQPLL